MKRVKASDFPELQQVFSGYLHEDFIAEYGSAAGALRAFAEDASAAERQRFRKEVQRFLDVTAPLDFAKLRALLERLGSRWMPPSRDAVVTVLSAAAE
jgi:hypothetical protein